MASHRAVAATLGLAVVGLGCSFNATLSPPDGAPTDAPIDAPDNTPPEPGRAVVAVTRNAATVVSLFAFDDDGFEDACGEVAVGDPFKALVRHPQLPYVYGAESRLAGLGVDCGEPQLTNLSEAGGIRSPMQDIAVDAAAMVGFFTTVPDTGSISVHRFTLDASGVPSVGGSTRGPTLSGPLALDGPRAELFVGGAGVVFKLGLIDASLALPATFTHAAACRVVGLALRQDRLFAFCNDTAEVRRYSRSPFALVGQSTGPIGAIDRVVSVNAGAAVAARSSPPALVTVGLTDDEVTVRNSVDLPSRVTAMTLSPDKRTVVVARQVDPTNAELLSFRLDADGTLTPVGQAAIAGVVTAVTVTRL